MELDSIKIDQCFLIEQSVDLKYIEQGYLIRSILSNIKQSLYSKRTFIN